MNLHITEKITPLNVTVDNFKRNLFMDQQDMSAVKSITSANFGSYPVSPDWSKPDEWKDVLLARAETAAITNNEIHEFFTHKYGVKSDLAISTGIVAEITPEMTMIASAQIAGYKGPASWRATDKDSSYWLSLKIKNILSNSLYKDFFQKNPTFREGLMLIKDTFIRTGDPDFLQEAHSKYSVKCIKDNSDGKIVLNIPFESDYTHPVKKESDKTMVCEATVSILLPLEESDRKIFNKITRDSRDFLLKRKYAKSSERLNMLVGDSIAGAGFEALSAVSGEAFYLKYDKKTKYGFYLARNNFAKKEPFWKSCGKLMNFSESELDIDLTPYFTLLYVPHENAHIVFPQYDMFGEVPADVPAVIYSITECDRNFGLDQKQMIRAIFTEYASEIVESSTGGELFAGYKADETNRFLRDYLLSSVVIVNAIADTKLLTVSDGKIIIYNDPITFKKFIYELEAVDRLFHKNDPNIKARIRLAVLSPSAKRIIDLLAKH
ncbi:hypothetical protein A2394_00720 [Candidatus Woesebacteria bacterium RIFOXYB1_FULL_42_36]|nr:MAG: hypothetical protein A2208_02725 [Candidatus Woesebacteria bacterium RIFOXYA1_FULL_43_16]OGM82039.1 MAG: hypothetical protein A2394_00720 [Candidatus Woesebacteria bacterium RIFOXYB1_FULL_42_36]